VNISIQNILQIIIIKNSIIHIHLSYFTSKLFKLFKYTTYNFRSILFRFANSLPQMKWL